VTEDVLTKEYNVSIVVHGNTATEPDLDGSDPYAVSIF
jgi:ethanolamine-phosphate cytidylyltransferase